MTADATQGTAQYFHPEKWPAFRRAGMSSRDLASATARLAGTDRAGLGRLQREFDAANRLHATELLGDEAVAADVARLPFRQGDVILALGDSITDDALSWAHVLPHLIDARFGPGYARVENHGVTGDKTSDVISRHDTVTATHATWVIQLLGTNDARRHGTAVSVQTTSLAETARNLRELKSLIRAELQAQHVIMTPPPVRGVDADRWDPFRLEAITWRDDDVRAIADEVRLLAPDVVDLYQAFQDDAGAQPLLLPDGVHPSPAGQDLILRTLLRRLAAL